MPSRTHHLTSYNPSKPEITGQGLLALGLLEKLPVKPRTVGVLGVIASALNCYMMAGPLYPASPDAAAAKAKSQGAGGSGLPAGSPLPPGFKPSLKAA